jgi:hypothetical protein
VIGEKSSQFYVSREELLKNFYEDTSIEWGKLQIKNFGYFDCDDTMRTYKENNTTTLLSFRFFSEGKKYDVYVNTHRLILFVLGISESLILPARPLENRSKVVIDSAKNLKAIMQYRVLRKKFGKAIMRLQDVTHNKIIVTDDWCNYSFYFQKFYNDQYDYNGGLIFHKDHHNPANIAKGYYSIHT